MINLFRLKRRLGFAVVVAAFLSPALIGLALFQINPLLVAIRNSLFQMSLLNPDAAVFSGFDNYVRMLDDGRLVQSLRNTLLYAGGRVCLQVPIALMLAILVNQRIKGVAFVRSAAFAPVVTAGAVIAVLWNLMYHPENGILNALIQLLGLPKQPFVTSVSQAMPSLILMGLWQDTGFTMLLFLASLQGIPEEYYEAASIDGAGTLDRIRYITIPLLVRTILLAVVTTTLFSFRVFTPIYVLTQGGPQGSTRTVVYYLYEQGFRFNDIGYASAVAVIVILLLIAITLVQGRLLRAEFEY